MFTKGHMRFLAAVVAVLCGVVPWAALAFENSAVPGPSGTRFTGGTVPSAVVLTGDNAGGVGTLRIRPGDNDTHVVLCTGDNNAATEMCTAYSHDNFSATQSTNNIITNGYLDSAGAVQRNWTSGGYVRTMQSAGSTANLNYALSSVYGTGGSEAGYYHLQATGLTAATFQIGNTGTVTTDIRGPILNGGSATCNGYNAGFACITDNTVVANPSTASLIIQGTGDTLGYATVALHNSTNTGTGYFAYYGATQADLDLRDKVTVNAVGKTLALVRNDDVAAGTIAFQWMDGVGGAGVQLATMDGAGVFAPLLYGSQSNCSDGAGAAACSAAPVGGVVIDAAATTVVVSTTAVTANSRIMLQEDTSLALTGSPTCNTDAGRTYRVTARTAGTSFTITASAAPVTNPACLSYSIIN